MAAGAKVGDVLAGRYPILGILGQGGMGAVYRAGDNKLPSCWAIKEMADSFDDPSDRAAAEQALNTEIEMLSTLSHPNLPRITDRFSERGRYYVVMDLVEGEDLEKVLNKRKRLTVPEVVNVALQVVDVLEYLHSRPRPVVFRDLKPANIIVCPVTTSSRLNNGIFPRNQVKIIDFGIARYFKRGQRTDTQALGTPGYAAPEQYGSGQSDARSDIYAFGAALHHCLSGISPSLTPFRFADLASLVPGIPLLLSELVAQAVENAAGKRFQSAAAMHRALDLVASEMEGAPQVWRGSFPVVPYGGTLDAPAVSAPALPAPAVPTPRTPASASPVRGTPVSAVPTPRTPAPAGPAQGTPAPVVPVSARPASQVAVPVREQGASGMARSAVVGENGGQRTRVESTASGQGRAVAWVSGEHNSVSANASLAGIGRGFPASLRSQILPREPAVFSQVIDDKYRLIETIFSFANTHYYRAKDKAGRDYIVQAVSQNTDNAVLRRSQADKFAVVANMLSGGPMHRYIAQVHEWFSRGLLYYVVYDCAAAVPYLKVLKFLRQRPDGVASVCTMLRQISGALQYLEHVSEIGACYNLSLNSVMAYSPTEFVLSDCGLVNIFYPSARGYQAWSDGRYLPPETLRSGVYDSRSTVFSLGAMAHHALSDIPPRACQRAFAPIKNLCRGIDSGLAALITRAVQQQPSARFENLKHFRDELRGICERLVMPAGH